MRCAQHPDVETNLGCGRCGKPICPRCLVMTPVGARCPECARRYQLPTYRVSAVYYLRAAGAGLGVAVATGLIWGLLAHFVPLLYVNILLAAAIGYVCSEVIALSVNRKRGTGLAVIAGVAAGASYLTALLVPWGLEFWAFDLFALALGIFVAVARIK